MGIRLKSFLHFLAHSKNQYGIHSPFVYKFLTKCLYNYKTLSPYQNLKLIYQSGRKTKNLQHNLSYRKCKLLNRITNYLKPQNCLIIAKDNDFIASYLSIGNQFDITDLSLSKDHAKAKNHFLNRHHLNNIEVVDQPIEVFLEDNKTIFEMIFISLSSAEKNFYLYQTLLKHCSTKSFFIINHIHENQAIENTWRKIKDTSEARLTIDLFFWGIVFLRTSQPKQDFKIRYLF